MDELVPDDVSRLFEVLVSSIEGSFNELCFFFLEKVRAKNEGEFEDEDEEVDTCCADEDDATGELLRRIGVEVLRPDREVPILFEYGDKMIESSSSEP